MTGLPSFPLTYRNAISTLSLVSPSPVATLSSGRSMYGISCSRSEHRSVSPRIQLSPVSWYLRRSCTINLVTRAAVSVVICSLPNLRPEKPSFLRSLVLSSAPSLATIVLPLVRLDSYEYLSEDRPPESRQRERYQTPLRPRDLDPAQPSGQVDRPASSDPG